MLSQKTKVLFAVSFAWQFGFLVITPLIGFMVIGLWLDSRFNTHPYLTILGLLVGLFSSTYESYRLLKEFLSQGKENNA